ncbi:hypothetical protein [Micromonospora lutea]|uniref:DUF1349 domain-containing protein n=1 Tax=Micromonospora lutea TaxID=419825 RepID=A0ABQ4IVH3_9ACTN|nr:hypothetical protein [Micromonospora lutea]GIJ21928.1 hypothetical protein Vlu01_25520 [Micromonospora lutea]
MTAAWPSADDRLVRGYRRLLLAYPRRHRRRHGTELVTTLLEMAEPGQRRPRAGEALHLIVNGVRLRFRLPAGRPFMALAALLTALTMGGFGAAAGSWLGAQTFADLPDDATMNRLLQQAGGLPGDVAPRRGASPWQAESVVSTAHGGGSWDAEQVRQRFAADGWSVSGLTPVSGLSVIGHADGTATETRLSGAEFTAGSDGLLVSVRGWDHGHHTVWATPTRTAVFLPLVVVGTAVGLVVGWLVAAAVAYRITATSSGRRETAAGLWGLAVLALVLPAVALYGNVMRVFRVGSATDSPVYTVHSAFNPGRYYPFGPSWLVLGLTIVGFALAVATALAARPGEQPPPQQAAVAG